MRLQQFTLLIKLCLSISVYSLSNGKIEFRQGQKKDELPISLTMVKKLMNPLGIQAESFLVAIDTNDNNRRIGWAQIRLIGTARRDATKYNTRPGSYDIEDDVDDMMWEEFENEETPVPVGMASLPWTPEYRAFAAASQSRQARRELLLEREKQRDMIQLWELASVYVDPDYRGQGLGKELIKKVLKRHADAGNSLSNVYCLTLATRSAWYRDNFGFKLVPENEVPAQMEFEIRAGRLLAQSMGTQLYCMKLSELK